jgi:hypothetical protein
MRPSHDTTTHISQQSNVSGCPPCYHTRRCLSFASAYSYSQHQPRGLKHHPRTSCATHHDSFPVDGLLQGGIVGWTAPTAAVAEALAEACK